MGTGQRLVEGVQRVATAAGTVAAAVEPQHCSA